MQRAQSDDEFRHAGLRSNPLIPDSADRYRRRLIHAPKPPDGGGVGGELKPYNTEVQKGGVVDIVRVKGRWVFDSQHDGWNEIHPVFYVSKVGQVPADQISAGNWTLPATSQLAQPFQEAEEPETVAAQGRPENQWNLHPMVDGCQDDSAPHTPIH